MVLSGMRGRLKKQASFIAPFSIESLVETQLPQNHPLRRIKAEAESVLKSLSFEFDRLYADRGRPSVPPELMLMALLWQALFSIRSERQLIECLRFDLRCRWFVGLPLNQEVFDSSTFSKNREDLRLEIIGELFFKRHVAFLREEGLLSSDHLSVDGSLLAAWASPKSLVRRDELDKGGKPPVPPEGGRNGWVDFKGEKRSNETHVSASDPDSKLASKGAGAKLSHELNIVAENRNNFVVAYTVNPPTGTSERDAAQSLIEQECKAERAPETVGADRKYSEGEKLTEALFDLSVKPHFAVRDDRPNALARLFHDDDFKISIRKRMRIEEIFGYIKSVCGLSKVKVRGTLRVYGVAGLALSAYNLTHQARLALAGQ